MSRCTTASTREGRRRQRENVRGVLAMLEEAEMILNERGRTDEARIMTTVAAACQRLCIDYPRPDEDPNDLAEHLRWSPVVYAAKAFARVVIATDPPAAAEFGLATHLSRRVVLAPERIVLTVPK